jgi:hypothetical protein
MKTILLLTLTALLALAAVARAQNTAFTYQGLLTENGGPANGVFDFQFRLFGSTNPVGIALGTALVNDATATNGLFTVQLDFGTSPFSGPARWLEISVRPGASTGAYTTIAPLQPVTPTPYAITALGAAAGSISSAALANGAVTAAKLASNSITAVSLGTNVVVNTANIADGAVTSNKLANASVGGGQLTKPYASGFLSSYDFYFRLEPTHLASVLFAAPFATLPALALNVETLSENFAESAFARTDNRSTNGCDLKLRITNRLDSVVAAAETSSSILGLDSAMVGGRPSVAFPVVGCVVSAIPSTNVTVSESCWVEFSFPSACGFPPTPCTITTRTPVPCPGGDVSTFETNVVATTTYITNCSSPLLFARASDAAGNSWNTTLITATSAAEPSLAVVNGTPTIAFYSPSLTALRVVEATSSTGTNWGGTVTVANHADVGRYCSLATVNTRPAISYFNATSNNLEYVRFNAVNWSSRVVVEGTGGAGRHSSLAVVNGRPAIACFRSTIVGSAGGLVYYRANDLNGSTWGTRTTVDSNIGDLDTGSAVTNGTVISLAVVGGRPAIAYYDEGEDLMKYVRADDTNGTTWGTPISLPFFSISGGFNPSANGGSCRLVVLDGRPTVQFAAGPDVYVVTSRDATGTSWSSPVKIVDGSTSTAWAGGLLTTESQYASAFQIHRPNSIAPPQVLFTRRAPPKFAISWIAVQP